MPLSWSLSLLEVLRWAALRKTVPPEAISENQTQKKPLFPKGIFFVNLTGKPHTMVNATMKHLRELLLTD